MADLCARSEQCAFDVARKLRARGLSSSDIRQVIGELTDRRFLDEFRYARSFARDKVRFSAWGKYKIRAALLARRISVRVIEDAFLEIDPEDYSAAVSRAAAARASALDLSVAADRMKLYRHLLSRGFESDVAQAAIKERMRR